MSCDSSADSSADSCEDSVNRALAEQDETLQHFKRLVKRISTPPASETPPAKRDV
jgi:hypothetical protein